MPAAGAPDLAGTGAGVAGTGLARLICIPPAGAGTGFYREWPTRFGGTQVEPVDLPGRGLRTGEPLRRTVSQIAAAVADGLEQRDEPWNLFGHSLGAAVAFELVRTARARGVAEPGHLVVSGRSAPHLPPAWPALHRLPRDEFLAAVLAYGGTPREVAEHTDLMHALEPVLRADLTASETYTWDGTDPLDCAVTVVAATRDPLFQPREALPWRHVTTGPFRVVHVDGDHFHARRPVPALLNVLEEMGT